MVALPDGLAVCSSSHVVDYVSQVEQSLSEREEWPVTGYEAVIGVFVDGEMREGQNWRYF